MIDTTPLGDLIAEVVNKVTDEYADDQGFTIRTCAVIVEIDSPTDFDFVWACSDDRSWVLKALLRKTIKLIKRLERTEADD